MKTATKLVLIIIKANDNVHSLDTYRNDKAASSSNSNVPTIEKPNNDKAIKEFYNRAQYFS